MVQVHIKPHIPRRQPLTPIHKVFIFRPQRHARPQAIRRLPLPQRLLTLLLTQPKNPIIHLVLPQLTHGPAQHKNAKLLPNRHPKVVLRVHSPFVNRVHCEAHCTNNIEDRFGTDAEVEV